MARRFSIMKWVNRFRRNAVDSCPVLLYHGVYETPPLEIAQGLHNTNPDVLHDQLSWLKQVCRIVSIDELASAPSRYGLAAVTFDDGYDSVFDQAWPVLRDLDIPATVFLNGCALQGEVVWRDKVRYLINAGLVEQFEAFSKGIKPLSGLSFYRYTKDPRNNSRLVDAELDRFFEVHMGGCPLSPPCCSRPHDLIRHPLLSYGNHSQHHFVMSSLTEAEQREEIFQTKEILEQIPGIERSRVFSIPFGAKRDFNTQTLRIIRDSGYEAVAMSRFRLNRRQVHLGDLPVVERFMPDERPLDEQLEMVP